MKPRIFISAVSEEFATLRDRHIDPLLRKMGYEPITMTVFPTGHGDLRQWLRDQIDPCEGLIQLAGVAYGREPPIVADDIDRMSYTQFELHHALRSGKKVWVFTATDAATRDRPVSELDLPPAGALVEDTVAYQNERRELQRRYHEWLKNDGLLRHPFGDAVTLENRLHDIGDELHELYRQWTEMQAQIRTIDVNTTTTRVRSGRLLALVLLLLPLLVGVGLLAAPQVSCRLPGVVTLCTYLQLDKPNRDIGDIKKMMESLLAERAQTATVTGASDVRSPEALRSALEDIVETQEGQQALQRFQQGEEADALRDMDRLRAAQARSVANLALTALDRGKVTINDVVLRYDEVLRLDPKTWSDRIELARLLEKMGRLSEAKQVASDALDLAQTRLNANVGSVQAQREVAASLDRIGDVMVSQDDMMGALAAYERGLSIADTLARSDASGELAQRDLLVSLIKFGDIKVSLGDTADALVAYRRGLSIADAIALTEASSGQAQRDLSISLSKIGDVSALQGDETGALSAYQQSLSIFEALAQRDASSKQAQRDLSLSLDKVGRIKVLQDDMVGALFSFRRSLSIREALAQSDASSAQAQHDLWASLNKIGDVQTSQGDVSLALAGYQRGLMIAEALAASDTSSAAAQRDVAASHSKLFELATDQTIKIGHARKVDRIFTALDTLGARISPADRSAWVQIRQWLRDHQ